MKITNNITIKTEPDESFEDLMTCMFNTIYSEKNENIIVTGFFESLEISIIKRK